jgi:hypothetical protein
MPTGVASSVVATRVAPAGSLRVEMYDLRYHPGDINVVGATFTIFLVNPADLSSADHSMAIGVAIGQAIISSGVVPLGGSVAFTVRGLPPGQYQIWCEVDGHEQEGMVGTLTVH